MIRRTIRRAFGPSLEGRVGPAFQPVEPQASRVHQLHKIFKDLHETFSKLPRAGEQADLEVTPPRARPEGLEFTVSGPGFSCRFVDNMNGMIWIWRERAGEGVHVDVLTLHPDEEGALRLIEKPVRPGRAGRSVFRFTSVPEVAGQAIESGREGGARG
ncbi:MAG: hypothetical protein HY717_16625 [Planctomycetes bacterium]|nr:hypothetical protein [Planctomycetota bacterium]